ncbi:hypothetical protein LP7551_05062 [Roseibium album]|nr:hypothetical protein LP7551_05062 [Roseibium album]
MAFLAVDGVVAVCADNDVRATLVACVSVGTAAGRGEGVVTVCQAFIQVIVDAGTAEVSYSTEPDSFAIFKGEPFDWARGCVVPVMDRDGAGERCKTSSGSCRCLCRAFGIKLQSDFVSAHMIKAKVFNADSGSKGKRVAN